MPTLEEFFKHCNEYISSAIDEVENAQKDEENLKKAKEIFSVYSSFISAGFTNEQAWEILITLIENNKNSNN